MNHAQEQGQHPGYEPPGTTPQEPVARGIPPAAGRSSREWTGREREYLIEDPRRKSPMLAAILSSMPGLGQIYVGYYQQGFVNVLVAGSIIALLAQRPIPPLEPLLGIFLAFFWLYNVVDAGRRASFYNHTLAGLGRFDVPEDFTMPKGRGTLAGGAALVIFGCILFAHTMFRLSLDWLDQWWPIAIVGLGAYLIYQAIAVRRSGQRDASQS